MAVKLQEKIIVLWIVFLLGLLFHTQLGLMPLFHGLSVTESTAQSMAEITPILWLMLGFFLLPMTAIVATLFFESKGYRKLHFGLTVIYSILNLAHLIADLLVEPRLWYQIFLMVILFVIGLGINRLSWQWMQQRIIHRYG
jgi:hypothetical protein